MAKDPKRIRERKPRKAEGQRGREGVTTRLLAIFFSMGLLSANASFYKVCFDLYGMNDLWALLIRQLLTADLPFIQFCTHFHYASFFTHTLSHARTHAQTQLHTFGPNIEICNSICYCALVDFWITT